MSEPEPNRSVEQLREILAASIAQLTPETEPAITFVIEVEEDEA